MLGLLNARSELVLATILYCLAIFGSVKCGAGSEGKKWNYDTHGTDVWPHEFSDCAGKKQSPIDVNTNTLVYDAALAPFKLVGYDSQQMFNISNNGKTVVGNIVTNQQGRQEATLGVEGSTFGTAFYELLQFHFHWGYNDYQGSEHQVDGAKSPLELHLVHKSSETGLFTVLGFLFEITERDNLELEPLLRAVDRARSSRDCQMARFSLKSILPKEDALASYYRYSGSLTTPPCTEGIIWNLFTTKIGISSRQLTNFRVNNVKLNFREPQKLNGRTVYVSVESLQGRSAGSGEQGNHGQASALVFNHGFMSLSFLLLGLSVCFNLRK